MLKEDTVLGRRIRHKPEMPVPLVPYPTPPVPFTPPNGGQSQLVCSGCRNLLLYPLGATSVCCAVCSAVTAVPPPGTEMAQLICGGCHTLLMFIRGATSVQCSCCHTVNLALEGSTCQLWKLPYAVDVPIRSKIREVCSLQFCDFSWGELYQALNRNLVAEILETRVSAITVLLLFILQILLWQFRFPHARIVVSASSLHQEIIELHVSAHNTWFLYCLTCEDNRTNCCFCLEMLILLVCSGWSGFFGYVMNNILEYFSWIFVSSRLFYTLECN
ncbi:unnamed protein product, partial [Musa acuminata subsp. malaccensis]